MKPIIRHKVKPEIKEPVEIYFGDLKKEAQAKLLRLYHIKDRKEMNWDVFPLFTIEVEA